MSKREREAKDEELQGMEDHGRGTSLEDAFRLLSHASQERLLSLTFKLGHSQPEELVHAMCLITLRRGTEALDKLQTLRDSKLAKYLAEVVTRCRSRQEDFRMDPESKAESQVDILIDLARIFRVMTEEKLCSESLRDKAYQTALQACESETGSDKGQWKMVQLMQEARELCGPQFDAIIKSTFSKGGDKIQNSLKGLCSLLPFRHRGLDSSSAAIQIQGSPGGPADTGDTHSSPSSLRTSSSSCVSYPSHLEVSMSPTIPFEMCRIRDIQDTRPASSHTPSEQFLNSTLACSNLEEGVSRHVPLQPQENSAFNHPVEESANRTTGIPPAPVQVIKQPQLQSTTKGKGHIVQCIENSGTHQIVTSKNADTKPQTLNADIELDWGSSPESLNETLASTSLPPSGHHKSRTQTKMQEEAPKNENNEEDNEEGAQFFSFVILHSPEDVDIAENLQEKLEGLGVGTGATFSQDFAVPGQQTLTCIEDAIDNSAFTILLLSKNFNPRMLEFETNSALMNSIENRHKYNSVIPLLPRENCLPRSDIPRSLRTIVSLHEGNKNFDRMVKKAMDPNKIKRQKDVWSKEQSIQNQRRKQERLREDNKRNKDLVNETEEVSKLLQEKVLLQCKLWQQMQPCQFPYAPHPGQVPAPAMPPAFWLLNSQHLPINPDGQLNAGIPFGFQQPSIHIQNASCVMIGNDSQMTVGTGVENPHGETEVQRSFEEIQETISEDRRE